MENRIHASNNTLLAQSQMATEEFLDRAVDAIDGRFGNGYAKANPGLVGTMMMTMGLDFSGMFVARSIDTPASATESLANPLDRIAEAITSGE